MPARPHLGLLLASLCSVACAVEGAEPYSEDLAPLGGGKADGLADSAVDIALGETKTGSVDEDSIRLFRVALTKGDEIEVVKTVKSGDLAPDFILVVGLTSTIPSAHFDVDDDRLVKQYAPVDDTGEYFIAVRAFQHRGAGEFSLSVECTGGPCAGEFPVEKLSIEDADLCIGKARRCAFEGMARFDGAVGPARARQLFEGCLAADHTVDGLACSTACEVEDNEFLCKDVLGAIPFFADQSKECLGVLEGCMEECEDAGDGQGVETMQCWTNGFNGTCDGYAREHEACGGELVEGTEEQCHELCESTLGAWMDDLDTICTESC